MTSRTRYFKLVTFDYLFSLCLYSKLLDFYVPIMKTKVVCHFNFIELNSKLTSFFFRNNFLPHFDNLIFKICYRNGAIIRENGIRVATTQSTLTDNALSKSEVSLAKSDLSTTRSVSLTASSPSLHQLGSNTAVSDETTVLGRQDEQITSTPGTSVTSSLVSVNSQLQLEDVDAVEEEGK